MFSEIVSPLDLQVITQEDGGPGRWLLPWAQPKLRRCFRKIPFAVDYSGVLSLLEAWLVTGAAQKRRRTHEIFMVAWMITRGLWNRCGTCYTRIYTQKDGRPATVCI